MRPEPVDGGRGEPGGPAGDRAGRGADGRLRPVAVRRGLGAGPVPLREPPVPRAGERRGLEAAGAAGALRGALHAVDQWGD